MKDLIFLPIEIDIGETNFEIDTPAIQTFGGLWETKVIEDFKIPFIKKIIDQLPFEKLTLIKYNSQATDIPPHIDVTLAYTKDPVEYQNILNNEPAGYRLVLEGSKDKLEVYDGTQWKIAYLPKTPFVYVLNSTTTKHRVINETGRKTMYFRGFINKEKHNNLIEKNLSLFKDYAIYSNK